MYVCEIWAQHTHQEIHGTIGEMTWIVVDPSRGDGREGHKITQRALELFDFFYLSFHNLRSRAGAVGAAFPQFDKKLVRRHKKRIFLQQPPNDHHRMRPYDVHHLSCIELPAVVGAYHYVF